MSYHNGGKVITQNLSNYYDSANSKSYVTGSTVWKNFVGGATVNVPSISSYDSSSLNLQTNPAWTFPFTFTSNFSIELWYKTYTTGSGFTDQSKSPGILQIGTYNGNASITLWDWSQGQAVGNHSIRSFINNGATWTTSQGSSTTYSDPQWSNWHQIVMTFGGSVKWDRYNLYIDTVPQFSYTFSGISFPSSSIAGGNNIYLTGAAGGAINNDYAILRTYDYEMLQKDIVANYNYTKGRFGL